MLTKVTRSYDLYLAVADMQAEMDDFIVPDDEDSDVPTKGSKKKGIKAAPIPAKAQPTSTSRFALHASVNGTPTPFKTQSEKIPKNTPALNAASNKPFGKGKQEIRHSWLANVKDLDGHSPDHPDYDPRTLYIPPSAWNKFSPFETQYWKIKCKNYDTIVFFRKGKFYEIFENDACE